MGCHDNCIHVTLCNKCMGHSNSRDVWTRDSVILKKKQTFYFRIWHSTFWVFPCPYQLILVGPCSAFLWLNFQKFTRNKEKIYQKSLKTKNIELTSKYLVCANLSEAQNVILSDNQPWTVRQWIRSVRLSELSHERYSLTRYFF